MPSLLESYRGGVLFVGAFPRPDRPYGSVSYDLAGRLSRAGWTVATTSHRSGRLPRFVDMVTTAWRERRNYAVAVLDVFSGPAFRWAEVVAWTLRRARRPYVLVLRGGGLPDFAIRHPERVRRFLALASVVTSPSAFLSQRLQRHRADIWVVPNALDLANYCFRTRSAIQPKLVWLRAFHSIYNPKMALHALALVRRSFPAAQLRMCGPDKGDGTLAECQRLAETLGLRDAVSFLGPVPKREVPDKLVDCDVFLNTAEVDNTPMSVMEAMASGLCVVSTDVGGIPQLLRPGRDACLVPRGDAGAMAEAIQRLLGDPNLAARISTGGRLTVEEFDWPRILPRWANLLSEASRKHSSMKRFPSAHV